MELGFVGLGRMGAGMFGGHAAKTEDMSVVGRGRRPAVDRARPALRVRLRPPEPRGSSGSGRTHRAPAQ